MWKFSIPIRITGDSSIGVGNLGCGGLVLLKFFFNSALWFYSTIKVSNTHTKQPSLKYLKILQNI